MTEVDIWIKVLEKLNFKFIEEYSGKNNISRLDWMIEEDSPSITYTLYFNRKTEVVDSFFVWSKEHTINLNRSLNKQKFYNLYKVIFREVKLQGLVIS